MSEINLNGDLNNVLQMPAIVTICMIIGQLIKTSTKNPVVITKIPMILALIGGGIGILYFVFLFLTLDQAESLNPISFLLSGIISGLSSVGVHQTAKQRNEAKSLPYDKEIE